MSDVNIKTTWDSIPSSDSEYNTVLGVAGYDPDANRLFLSAQQVPNFARNVTTEYARGFKLDSGYDGITSHDAMAETPADIDNIKYTMSTAGSAYDLTDARCYVQFKNHYTVDIASWTLQAQAADDTLTTIATGNTIASGDLLQIDFKNDYNAARFILSFTFPGGSPEGDFGDFIMLSQGIPAAFNVAYGGRNYTVHVGLSDSNNINTAPTVDTHGWIFNTGSAYLTYLIIPHLNYAYCCAYKSRGRNEYVDRFQYSNEFINKGDYDIVRVVNCPEQWASLSHTFSTVEAAWEAFNNDLPSGLNTSDFDSYTGPVWQCRLLANIAAISPGPMATESEGGTEGDFDVTSDQISAPGLPSEGYAGTASMYLIDKTNLARLKLSIFSANFWQQWITNFNDAVNSIVGILQIPVDASAISTGSVEHVRAANKELEWALGTVTGYVEGKPIQSRYISVDCGTVNLHLFWDSALDLNPYTKLNIYIPCVGIRTLDPDVVMGHTLGLYYNIDLMQGCALAVLTIDGDYLEQYPCSISTMFAIYGEQFTGLYQSVASTLATAAIGVTTAGSGGAMAGAIAGAATSAMAQKIHKGSAGTSASSMALLYQKQPYVEILRPIQQLPRDYTKFNAYPSYMTAQLINLSGYVEVQDIRLDDIDCTDAERSELMSMLQSGVIL